MISIITDLGRKENLVLKNLDFSGADGKLFVPNWVNSIYGTPGGIGINYNGKMCSEEESGEFLSLVESLGIKSNKSPLPIDNTKYVSGENCVF